MLLYKLTDMSVKKTGRNYSRLFLAILIILGSLVVLLKQKNVYAGTPGSVIINEIMYNPGSGNQDDEFLELHNTTASPINLEGWCFSEGITLVTAHPSPACFPSGTTISANGYLIVSPSASQTNTTYGITPTAVYTGTNLSNGGETITLVDETAQVINTFTYDDAQPWSSVPDGSGPSLELKSPNLDGSLASNWLPSFQDGGTALSANSPENLLLPSIILTEEYVVSNPSTATSISATISSNPSSVTLTYKHMFNAEVQVSMFDDGAHGDGSAGDQVYGASIPGFSAGDLVRYKINATNGQGSIQSPYVSDSIGYHGYVIQDSSVSSQVPIMQLFMEPSELNDMIINHSQDDQKFTVIISQGSKVFDNAQIWIKGGVKRVFPKKSFAVDLPAGYTLKVNGLMERYVDEFHLDADFIDGSGSIHATGWKIAKEIGMDVPDVFKLRMQHNGDFYGMYTFIEEYDNNWREQEGYSSGSFYKENELKTATTDPNELSTWQQNLAIPRSESRREYAVNNLDVPNIINYMAYMALIHNWEWHNGKNLNKYLDTQDTKRWRVLPWDIDGSILSTASGVYPTATLMTPWDIAAVGDEVDLNTRFQFLALYDEPDFREMYFRRLRTLADEYLSNDRYLTLYREQKIEDRISQIKLNMLVRFRQPWAMPESQSSSPAVEIESVSAGTLGESEDYILLKNNGSESVDISGWQIDEIGYTIPLGSVLLPGGEAYLLKNDFAYRSSNSGVLVFGQYTGSLVENSSNQLTLKRKNGSVSNQISY
jgi:CotH kinase protein/Lamin Tail Domain